MFLKLFASYITRISCFVKLHPGTIIVNNQLDAHFFLGSFIYILYMLRAAMRPSSGESLYQCDSWFMSRPSGIQVNETCRE